jgi:amino acid transporter
VTATHDTDRQRLHELGYAQELNRKMGWFSNFAISFSIISILAGGTTTYFLAGFAGGPRMITLSWIIVGFFALLVGMAMAEIVSVYPTAGGLYYWSGKLARKNGAMWSWFTGWFNLIGQIGVIASVDYGLALFTGYLIKLYDEDFGLTPKTVFVIFVVMLVAHALINAAGVNLVKLLGDISVWWHVAGVLVIFAILLIAPDNREGFGFIFDFNNGTGWTNNGGGSFIPGLYASLIGLLLAQYTITGFDASAHVSEETTDSGRSASIAIVRSIYISAIAALILNIAMLQATPKGTFNSLILGTDGFLATGGANALAAPLGGAGAKLLIAICVVGQFFCGMASVTANSRMIYAFARDGAIPGHRLWHRINPRTRTPTNSIWLGCGLSMIVGALSLYQANDYSVAFFAMTGMCVVGLYIAYVIPIYLRLTNPDFQPGTWNLGKYSKLVGWTSVVWVAFITVLFFAPPFWPFWPPGNKTVFGAGTPDEFTVFHLSNFNFTGPIIIGLFIIVAIWWMVSAKNWFTGPKVQGTPEELRAIEEALERGDVATFRRLEDAEDARITEEQHGH